MSDHQIDSLDDLLERLELLASNPATAPEAAALTAALFQVLESTPVIAEINSAIAANQANGLPYHHAVENQQMTNILGMVATAQAVRALLDPPL